MITLKRLNVVRKAATEEQAAKLERLGFTRMDGTAETPAGAGVSRDDFAKMGEAMFENLCGRVDARIDSRVKEAAEAESTQKNKPGKGLKEEDKDGQTDQPGGGDGAE